MIRVVIVDDHGLVRAGLDELLSAVDDIEVVATAADGLEAVATVERELPHVVMMDLSMPNLDGVEATRLVVEAHPEVHVVALTSFSERERVLRALDAGAVGYLLKDSEPGDLERAIHAAARGESPLHPKAAQAVVAARTERRADPELRPREREVLELVAQGMPNKLIARKLGISEKTVKSHLTQVFQAIGATDRTQAALWAREHDLGSGDSP
jgi:DNA-binding NarL/FixJ family response regulator